MLRALVALLLILTLSEVAAAAEDTSTDRFKIHVLTMGQGEELFTRFGHIALMVQDRETRTKRIYNFGTFDFDDPALAWKYGQGFLDYWLSVGSFGSTIRRYRAYDRELVVRTLDLSSEQAAEVARRLEINALPENRTYAYRHYFDNCCTRIRDLLDDVVGGALSRGRDKTPTGRTHRDWTRKALANMPFWQALVLLILGPAIDKPITRYDEQFLPEVIAEDLDNTRIGPDNRPIVAQKRIVVERRGPPIGIEIPTLDRNLAIGLFFLLGIGFVLPLVLKKRPIAARLIGFGLIVWGLVAGIGGLALVFLWTATTHYDCHYNENLLVMPVLHLWLLGPGLKLLFKGRLKARTARILVMYLLFALGLIALDVVLKLGPFIQDNWNYIIFAVICNVLALFGLRRTCLPRN